MFKKNSEGETRLGESRRLKDLAKIVVDDEALKTFKAGRPLDSALLLTGAPLEVYREAISKAHARLEDARAYLHVAKGMTETDREALLDLRQLARFISDGLLGKLDPDADL